MKFILVLLFSLQINYVYPSTLLNPLKCFAWESPCLTASGENPEFGYILRIPELDTLKLDPFEIDYLKKDHNGLSFEAKDTKVYGVKNAVIDAFGADANTSTVHLKFSTDLLVTGLYKTCGSLFYLPINGEGDFFASLKNVVVELSAPYNIFRNANGEDCIEATSNFKVSYDVKDNAEFRLNNLHYGFSGLSELIHYLINANWKYMISEYAKGFIDNAAEEILARTQFKSFIRLEPVKLLAK